MTLYEKLGIMKEYVEKTGKEIDSNTVYGKYNLGIWQRNLRQHVREGKQVKGLDSAVEEELKKIGVLGERGRRVRTTDEKKLEIIKDFIKENPDVEIKADTISQEGDIPIGLYKQWINVKYNRGELSDELISKFKEIGIIKSYPEGIEESIIKYQLSPDEIMNIIRDYGNIEEFTSKYKKFEIPYEPDKLLYNLKDRGVIPMDAEGLSDTISKRYSTFYRAILGKRPENDEGPTFYRIDKIDEVIQTLTEREREVLKIRFGLESGETKTLDEVAKIYGSKIGREKIRLIESKALRKLRHPTRYKHIKYLSRERIERIETELEELKGLYENVLNNNEEIEEYVDYFENGEMTIEELDFSTRTYNCLRKDGIETVQDIVLRNKDELRKIRNLSGRAYDEIAEKLGTFGIIVDYYGNFITTNKKIRKISKIESMGYKTLDDLKQKILQRENYLMSYKNEYESEYEKWLNPENSIFIYRLEREDKMNDILEEFKNKNRNNIKINDAEMDDAQVLNQLKLYEKEDEEMFGVVENQNEILDYDIDGEDEPYSDNEILDRFDDTNESEEIIKGEASTKEETIYTIIDEINKSNSSIENIEKELNGIVDTEESFRTEISDLKEKSTSGDSNITIDKAKEISTIYTLIAEVEKKIKELESVQQTKEGKKQELEKLREAKQELKNKAHDFIEKM